MMKKILFLSVLNINGTEEKKCPVAWSDSQKMIMMGVTVIWGFSELSKLIVNIKTLGCKEISWCKDKSCRA